jgi:Ca2+-binding RTX toxin-like protein
VRPESARPAVRRGAGARGPGNDVMTGGDGNDDRYGNFGNDSIAGADGNDYINERVGEGSDRRRGPSEASPRVRGLAFGPNSS